MKAVLISIRSEWTRLILSGEKTIEVRKTRPKLETPFKVYIYQTLPKSGDWNERDGHVIGEFVCWGIDVYRRIGIDSTDFKDFHYRKPFFGDIEYKKIGLSESDLKAYGKGKLLYGWHISELKVYDKPKQLSEFLQCHKCEYKSGCKEHEYSCDGTYQVSRPPQSWCYVESLEGGTDNA